MRKLRWRWVLPIFALVTLLVVFAAARARNSGPTTTVPIAPLGTKLTLTEEEWKKRLSAQQFNVLRKKGTELPFTGRYNKFKGKGVYLCSACGHPLFSSEAKYESGTGWPSFWKPLSDQSIRTEADHSLFMKRIEVVCSRCDSHLGHVFEDGPKPTGLRYCMNSVALQYVPQSQWERHQKDQKSPAPPRS